MRDLVYEAEGYNNGMAVYIHKIGQDNYQVTLRDLDSMQTVEIRRGYKTLAQAKAYASKCLA